MAQVFSSLDSPLVHPLLSAMAPAMKAAMKGAAAMSKSGIAAALAEATEQVKSVGKFTIPGLCMLKTRKKPATKAGKREVFGKVVMVKAKPASTVVKAYCVAALKKSI